MRPSSGLAPIHSSQKVLRTVYVWLVPVVGPMLYLRSTAELDTNAVPSRPWLWPVRWLFYVKPSTISCTPEDAADVTLEHSTSAAFDPSHAANDARQLSRRERPEYVRRIATDRGEERPDRNRGYHRADEVLTIRRPCSPVPQLRHKPA
jgi:hypothetical protein